MRGKHRIVLSDSHWFRIIPAHAGQTTLAWNHPNTTSDHPRACGANMTWTQIDDGLNGSSPRMRGKRSPGVECRQSMRIIPAHAGQTSHRCTTRTRSTDHPRACGANIEICEATNASDGSSPRMRGKLQRRVFDHARVRIIPAHAGQTLPLAC